MAQIIWTEPALTDLTDLAEYIALSNPTAAAKCAQQIFEKVQRLADFPNSGRVPPELEQDIYRELVVNPCRIFYRQEAEKVFILHLMRQEAELRKYLLS